MFRKFFASLFILVFVVFSVPAIILFGFYQTIFNVDFYKGPLLNEVYNRAIPIIVDEIYVNDKNILGKYFKKEEIVEIVKRDIPQDVFRNILDDVFKQLDLVLNAGKSKITLKLDSVKDPLKKLVGDLQNTLFTEKIPQCKKGESPRMLALPSCMPSGVAGETYKKRFNQEIDNNLKMIFSNIKPIEIDARPIIQNLETIKAFELVAQALFASLGILCLLILLVLWKPLARGLKWLGVPFIIASFEALVMYKMIPLLISSTNIRFNDIPEKYLDDVRGIINFMVSCYQKQLLYVVIFSFSIGFAMILTGYFLPKKINK